MLACTAAPDFTGATPPPGRNQSFSVTGAACQINPHCNIASTKRKPRLYYLHRIRGKHSRTGRTSGTWKSFLDYRLTSHCPWAFS